MKQIKEKFEALKSKIETYDSLPHPIVELMPFINELEKEIHSPKYVYNIAFGKELCFSLWEDDYARCAELINNGIGDIVGYNRFEDGIEEVLQHAVGSEDYAFVNDEILERINKLL
jgi:hypothetical protein